MKKNQNTKRPFVSVIMPVYNAGDFLVQSIESILKQTYKNFEFIIIDDASTDSSYQILKKFKKRDKRIRIFRIAKKNIGVSETVKYAITKAKGDFIARMDADDVAIKTRISKQVVFLLKNRNTVAVGGQCSIINKNGEVIGEKIFPTKFKEIYSYIFKFVPLQQPTLMIARKRLPKDFEFYHDGLDTAEELELLFKLFQYGKVENLGDIVLLYRLHDKNTSLKDIKKTFLYTLLSRFRAVIKYHYRPTITGIIFTLFQALLVLLLPQTLVFWLYEKMRKLHYSMKYSRLGLQFIGEVQ